jgi:hypothetical protein
MNSQTCTTSWLNLDGKIDKVRYRMLETAAAISNSIHSEDPTESLKKEITHFNTVFTEIKVSTKDVIPTRFMMCVNEKEKEIYIGIKGTSNFQDFLADVKIFGIPNKFEGQFHYGMYSIASFIPLDLLRSFLEEYEIIFTGHSLGAAVAGICAASLVLDHLIGDRFKSKVHCIGFGLLYSLI